MAQRATSCSVSAACFDAAVSERDDGLRIAITVRPGSKKNSIEDGPQGDRLLVRVNAPPVDGRANDAVIAFLADVTGAKKRQLRIVHGYTGREKLIAVAEMDASTLRAAVGPAMA